MKSDLAPAACAAPVGAGARRGFFILLLLLLLAGAQKQVTGNTLDPDVFWHMRVGQQLLRDGIRPLVDEISFNSVRRPWTPYSWLAELVLEQTWRAGGLRAAVVLGAGLIAAFVALLAWACYQQRRAVQRDEPPADGGLAVLLATAIGMALSLRYLTLRPVTMAFVVMGACVVLLLRDRRLGERSRAVWLVPPLVALGINFHFFAAVIPLYIACLLAGAWWERLRGRTDIAAAGELAARVARYALLAAAAGVGCAVTPMLGGIVDAVLHYTVVDPMVESGKILEMRPLYEGGAGIVSLALVVGIVAWVAAARGRFRAGELLGMAAAAGLIVWFGRFLPVFALVASPLLAAALPSPSRSTSALRSPRRLLAHPATLLAGLAAVAWVGYRIVTGLPDPRLPDSVWLNRLPDAKGYPCEAADYVLEHVPRRFGRVINEFGWGGYLGWRLRGRYQVLIDGRTQLYPPGTWGSTYLGSDDRLVAFLASADADAAILSHKAARFENALRELGWKIAYADERSRVWLPPLLASPGMIPTTGSLPEGR
jgi:hypothetical protein